LQPNQPEIETNSFAKPALIAGIVAVFLFEFFIPSIAAIILGALGMNRATVLENQKVLKTGKRSAIAGLVLGLLYLLAGFYYLMVN
jgi:hypothetical protein